MAENATWGDLAFANAALLDADLSHKVHAELRIVSLPLPRARFVLKADDDSMVRWDRMLPELFDVLPRSLPSACYWGYIPHTLDSFWAECYDEAFKAALNSGRVISAKEDFGNLMWGRRGPWAQFFVSQYLMGGTLAAKIASMPLDDPRFGMNEDEAMGFLASKAGSTMALDDHRWYSYAPYSNVSVSALRAKGFIEWKGGDACFCDDWPPHQGDANTIVVHKVSAELMQNWARSNNVRHTRA